MIQFTQIEPADKVVVSGVVSPSRRLFALGAGAEPSTVKATVVTGDIKSDKVHRHVLVVEEISLGVQRPSFGFEIVDVPEGTKIKRAEIDFASRLWVLAECNDKQSLFVWDLAAERVYNPLPWSTTSITFGFTRATDYSPGAKMMIAGLVNATKFSSLSFNSEQFRGAAK